MNEQKATSKGGDTMNDDHLVYIHAGRVCTKCGGTGIITDYHAGCVQRICPQCHGSQRRPVRVACEGDDHRAEAGRESQEAKAAS